MVADVAIGAFTQVLFTFLGAAALILGATVRGVGAHAPRVAGAGDRHRSRVRRAADRGGPRRRGPAAHRAAAAPERPPRRPGSGAAAPPSIGRCARSGVVPTRCWPARPGTSRPGWPRWSRPGWSFACSGGRSAGWRRWPSRAWPRRRGARRSWSRAASACRRGRWWPWAPPSAFAAPAALALAVVKRGRELLVGAPAIVAWVIAERHSIATFWSRRTMKERRRVEREVTSPSLPVVRRAAAPACRRARRPLLEPDGGRSRQDLGAAGGDGVRGG